MGNIDLPPPEVIERLLPQNLPDQSLDISVQERIQRQIDAIPVAERQLPVHGEMFPSPKDALDRIQNAAFCNGFAIVTKGGSAKTRDRVQYACIHHGEMRNWRKLTDDDRKRQRKSVKKGCPWEVYVSLRSIPGNKKEKAWQIGISNTTHSHELTLNPLTYPVHVKRHPDYNESFEESVRQRSDVIPFNTALVLKEAAGLHITSWSKMKESAEETEG